MSGLRLARPWQVAEVDRQAVARLAKAAQVPPLLAHLLLLRGQGAAETVADYLRPRLHHLSDPFALTDMDTAVARITQARDNREPIQVFGDYDVDGVAATAILVNGLRRFGCAQVSHAMPDRMADGYGLNPDHVAAAQRAGVRLLITVDNGIRAFEAAEAALDAVIDLIVTDHHALADSLPPACAVLNPQREAEDHPARLLCGAGVAFKLACALNGSPNDLDLAALGTVADIVPLQGENRVIVALGLRHMARHARTGLAALARVAKVDIRQIGSEHIGFQLGPRINAAGRLAHAGAALDLLMTDEAGTADALAQELCAVNDERRRLEERIFRAAMAAPEAEAGTCSLVLAGEDWHAGVVGIVASRVQARLHRPVVLLCAEDDGTLKGSARAGEGFDLVAALDACAPLLLRHGGHRAAAGLTLAADALPAFQAAFEAACAAQCDGTIAPPPLRIDVPAALSQIDHALMQALDRLEPFGHGNPQPVFCTYNVEVVDDSARALKERHLKFLVRQEGVLFEAIGFGMAEAHPPDALPPWLDLAYVPRWNVYRGEARIQLVLRDLRPAPDAA